MRRGTAAPRRHGHSGTGKTTVTRVVAGAVVLALTLLPKAAWACAVCNDIRDKNRIAFLATTAFLTVLPLSLVAGLLAYLRRRARQAPPPADSAS